MNAHGHVLSQQVILQLETALYKEFMDKFALFSNLKISIIRYIKQNIKYVVGKTKLFNGSAINEVIFVTHGNVTI